MKKRVTITDWRDRCEDLRRQLDCMRERAEFAESQKAHLDRLVPTLMSRLRADEAFAAVLKGIDAGLNRAKQERKMLEECINPLRQLANLEPLRFKQIYDEYTDPDE